MCNIVYVHCGSQRHFCHFVIGKHKLRFSINDNTIIVPAIWYKLEFTRFRGQVLIGACIPPGDRAIHTSLVNDSRSMNAVDEGCTSFRLTQTWPCELLRDSGSSAGPGARIPTWQRSSQPGRYRGSRPPRV